MADFIGIANFLPGQVRAVNAEEAVVDSPLGTLAVTRQERLREGNHVVLVLRPEALQLMRDTETRGHRVRIRSTSFLGGTHRHIVQLGEFQLVVEDRSSRPVGDAGDEACLTVDPAKLHILPAGDP